MDAMDRGFAALDRLAERLNNDKVAQRELRYSYTDAEELVTVFIFQGRIEGVIFSDEFFDEVGQDTEWATYFINIIIRVALTRYTQACQDYSRNLNNQLEN